MSITDQEAMVFNVVQDFLNENRIFNFKEITPYIVSRFAKAQININSNGILEILNNLAKKKMVVEGSKLSRNDILLTPKRKAIYDFIMENPGVYYNQILKKFQIANHIVIWHLKILMKFDIIKVKEIDSNKVYFDIDADLTKLESSHIASKEKAKKIIDYLTLNDIGVTKTKIAKGLKIHMNTLTKYLKSLEDLKIISKEKRGNQILYFLEEEPAEEVVEKITEKPAARKMLRE